MSRNAFSTELRKLLQRHWVKLEEDLQKPNLLSFMDRLETMGRLIDSVGVYDEREHLYSWANQRCEELQAGIRPSSEQIAKRRLESSSFPRGRNRK